MVQELLVDPERRRRWSDEQKMAIVVEAASSGASVSDVARRHRISRQQIYRWHSDIRQGRLVDHSGGPFLAVEFVGMPSVHDAPVDEGTNAGALIEVIVRKGRSLRVPVSMAPGIPSTLIRAVEAA